MTLFIAVQLKSMVLRRVWRLARVRVRFAAREQNI